MARFSDESLRKLKDETDIVALIESYGTKLKERGGDELIGLCPLHDDKNPSLVVNRKKGVWNCLGACQTGGDVFKWVMKADNVGFRHAVELLSSGATGSTGGVKFTSQRRLECPLDSSLSDGQLLQQVANYYQSRLEVNVDAQEYLTRRGIGLAEAITTFGIGCCDRSLGLRLPHSQVKAGKELRNKLIELGILRSTGHEHLRGCVTFPVTDSSGVTQIYGRRIQKALVRENGKATVKEEAAKLWLSRPIDGVWNAAALQACDEIIICESIIDALTFWCNGFRNVTTTFSSSFFPEQLKQALLDHNIKKVLLAYDNDDAGKKATLRDSGLLIDQLGLEVFMIRFPAGMDANEYALKVTPAAQALDVAIRKADWLGRPTKAVTAESVEKPSQSAAKEEAIAAVVTNEPIAKPAPVAPVKESKAQPAIEVTASPTPATPTEVEATIGDKEISFTFGNRAYRVRGFEKVSTSETMKVNLLVRREELFHVDTFDLYASRARGAFIKEASTELHFDEQVIKRDLGKILLKLEQLQDKQLASMEEAKSKTIELSEEDQQAALELLKSPNLIERILGDFAACGVVGEETNKLVGYLAVTSRKLDRPLAVIIQSSSAAGKSSLMDAVLRFMPLEEQVNYSAMTGQSLFYMGGMDLQHKILSIAEEEGVAQASYALKLLQSEGQLTIASTGKDPGTGRMETQEYHVEGPVMIFLTTTAIDIDEELLNRCLVLTVDENREQTRAIHDQQRHNETLEGLLSSQDSASIRTLHQNAQRLIRPLAVVNPFATKLEFIDDCARRRRDHMKYLALIRSIALLHQYQREVQTQSRGEQSVQYIEATVQDIALANRLADQVLGKSIDELPPQTRRLLIDLHAWARREYEAKQLEQREFRFTRRDMREALGWNQTALRKHVERLIEMEYMLPHRGAGRRVEYELLYDGRGREGQPTMCGLIDMGRLASKSTPTPRVSSPLDSASSPLGPVSSPLDHPESTPLSPSLNGKKLNENNSQMRQANE